MNLMNSVSASQEYQEDYSHLSGLWDDFKSAVSSVVKAGASVVKPVASELVYKQVTGEALPPKVVQVQPQYTVKQASIPSWVYIAGAGAVGLMLLMKMKAFTPSTRSPRGRG